MRALASIGGRGRQPEAVMLAGYKSRKKLSRMAGREAGKKALAPEVGRTCSKALSGAALCSK